jgi:hypothetical protein
LDSHPSLHFHLLTQSLIELIRQGRTVDALKFAQTELAPRGEKNEEFLKELESVMCLLAFGAASNAADAKGKDRDTKRDPKVDAPAQLMGLLSMQQRDLTASVRFSLSYHSVHYLSSVNITSNTLFRN